MRPGELIPVDGRIVDGHSALDQAPITGESMPVEKAVGEEVYAGSINGNGALRIRVECAPESSLIRRIVRLVEKAQTEAPPSQRFIERFERGYVRVVVAVGILLVVATVPALFWNWTWEATIYRALIFLVVASPCALMAAIMPTSSRSRRRRSIPKARWCPRRHPSPSTWRRRARKTFSLKSR